MDLQQRLNAMILQVSYFKYRTCISFYLVFYFFFFKKLFTVSKIQFPALIKERESGNLPLISLIRRVAFGDKRGDRGEKKKVKVSLKPFDGCRLRKTFELLYVTGL